MLHTLNRRLSTLAAASTLALALAGLAPTGASAALLTASYSGTVDGFFDRDTVLNVFPIGTAVSWEFTFDDAFRTEPGGGEVLGRALQGNIDGWLQIGADRIELERFSLYQYAYNGITGDIRWYRPRVGGSGPTIAGGGEFYELLVTMPATLDAQSDALVGYSFTTTTRDFTYFNYAYVSVSGMGSIRPAHAVPAPATSWLALPALAWMLRRPRRLACRER